MRNSIVRRSHAAFQQSLRPSVTTKSITAFYAHQRRCKSARVVRVSSVAASSHSTSISASASKAESRNENQVTLSADPTYALRGIVHDLHTTRPAPLELPEPPHPLAWPSSKSLNPSRWDFKYLLALGKAHVKLYWSGIKGVYANHKTRKEILQRLNGTSPDTAARSTNTRHRISFNEYELCLRAKRDILRLIPFGLVFAICGEFTPLVIVALGSRVVPGTCVIPKQELQDRKKALRREEIYMQEVRRLWPTVSADYEADPSAYTADHRFLLLEAYRLGLTPFTSLPAPLLKLYHSLRLSGRLTRHCNELLSTAFLVQREGGWGGRSPQDMWDWGRKYGMYTLNEYTKQALAKGEHPVSEKLKETLLPTFDKETRAIVDMAKRTCSQPHNCAMVACHTPLHQRPDCKAQRRGIENQLDQNSDRQTETKPQVSKRRR